MPEHSKKTVDSLDMVELVMALEGSIGQDVRLPAEDREWLIHEIAARIERGEFGDESDLDDDFLASLVRRLGPKGPPGQAGAKAMPEDTIE